MTTMLAKKPNTICNTMLTIKYVPCEVLPSLLRAIMPETTRAKKTTNVLTTPCISVNVTISPLPTCAISCAKTASTSSRVI